MPTPNIVVHTCYNEETGETTTISIGKGYRPQNDDVYIGITLTKQQSRKTMVYNVDTSQLPRGYKFTWTDKDKVVMQYDTGNVQN